MSVATVVLAGRSGFTLIEATLVGRAQTYLVGSEALREAGGVLLGCYRGDHLDVVGMTCPLPGDVRTRTTFGRRDPGHAEAARSSWEASGHTTGFVGEWHTHTGRDATPSTTDLRTWRKILARSEGRRHLFLIFAMGGISAHEGVDDQIWQTSWPANRRGEGAA